MFGLVVAAAAFSIDATVQNMTPYPMYLTYSNCTMGGWVTYPPSTIASGSAGIWRTDGGFLGGTGGYLIYSVAAQNGPQAYYSWYVPAAGSSVFNVVAIPPNYSVYQSGSASGGPFVIYSTTQRYADANATVATPRLANK